MDIVCRKQNCAHNKCTKCYKKEIIVDKESICTSYEKGNQKTVEDVSKNMLKSAPKNAPFKHVCNMSIMCKADCVHNDNGECMANGIIVNSVKEIPECLTYVKK